MLPFYCILGKYPRPLKGILDVLMASFPSTSLSPLKKLLFSEQMKSHLQRRRTQGSA